MISLPESIATSTRGAFDDRLLTRPTYPLRDRLRRACWGAVYRLLFRPSPRPFHGWRRFLLRRFGAGVGNGSRIYPKAIIWAPWNLTLGRTVAVADDAEIYNPAPVTIQDYAVISQRAYLCTASHDYTRWSFPLVSKAIVIGTHAWVASRAILGPGVVVGDGCVIGAGSVVTKSMPAWWVCAGNPCKPIKSYEKKHD